MRSWGAALRRSGGEYTFLGRIYHPAAGFVSGWISATVGFAAPTALAAITFWHLPRLGLPRPVAHLAGRRPGGRGRRGCTRQPTGRPPLFQRGFTTAKVILIAAFCVAATTMVDAPQPVALLPESGDAELVFGGAFAVSLIYVSYAYTRLERGHLPDGRAGESRTHAAPRARGRNRARHGPLSCSQLHVPARRPESALEGRLEVGPHRRDAHLRALRRRHYGVTLAVLLVSTVSAIGHGRARACLHVIGEDYPAFRFLERRTPSGIPRVAILTQAALSLLFIFSASFEAILVFSGFTLGAEQPACGGGDLRAAEARAGPRAPLPSLGIPGHAGHLPGADLVDAALHPDRPPGAGPHWPGTDRSRAGVLLGGRRQTA